MVVTCTFSNNYFMGRRFYACRIMDQSIAPNCELNLYGKHSTGSSNNDVNEVIFGRCKLSKIPPGLTKIFPNILDLNIWGSTLRTVNKEDLAEYKMLERIDFSANKIEFLPDDLFEGFVNLEEISFNGNKLKIVEPNILDGLKKLKFVDFGDNPNFRSIYSMYPEYKPNATLREVKNELIQVFCKNVKAYKNVVINDYKDKMYYCQEEYEKEYPQQESSFIYDIYKFTMNDNFKDFTIQVGGREFHVHKFVLAARSPLLAEIIQSNPHVEKLDLFDISVEVFEIVLKFVYTNELPWDKAELNFAHLFAAAGNLKIEDLKNFAARQILKQINGNNAFELLVLGNRYEHEELRQGAFDEVKKKYPRIAFKEKLAAEPENVAKLIKNFNKKEEAIRRLEEEFENEMNHQ